MSGTRRANDKGDPSISSCNDRPSAATRSWRRFSAQSTASATGIERIASRRSPFAGGIAGA